MDCAFSGDLRETQGAEVTLASRGAAEGGRPGNRRRKPQTGKYPDCYSKFEKTVMCRFLPRCRKGNDCPFAHAEYQVRVRPDLSKTRMCAGYYDGRCKLASNVCPFAHGEWELRTAPAQGAGEEFSSENFAGNATGNRSAQNHPADESVVSAAASAAAAAATSAARRGSSRSAKYEAPLVQFGNDFEQGPVAAGVSCDRLSGGSTRSGTSTPEGAADGSARDASPYVQPVIVAWAEDMRFMVNMGTGPVNLPSAQDVQHALVQAMPEYYED